MKYVNLTPHTVVIFREDESYVQIPASGTVARVIKTPQPAGSVDGIPVVRYPKGGSVSGISLDPDPEAIYLVSSMALDAIRGMNIPGNYYAPDTGPDGAVRDRNGRIIGVRQLVAK